MPDDDRRPTIQRTSSSLFAGLRAQGSSVIGGPLGLSGAPDPRTVPMSPLQQRIAEAQEGARRQASAVYDQPESQAPKAGNDNFYADFLDDVLRTSQLQGRIQASGTSQISVPDELASEVAVPLSSVANPADQFLFDRSGGVIDPLTGDRTGVLQARGVYGSADSLERQLPAGQTVETGTNENMMTISAGVLWLRNLAARDKAAYNKLVVLLRNANYGQLSTNDAELPLNGYSNTVGAAFALAAADLSQASAGGDTRTLMEYLTQRGQGYADFLAQEEADRAAAEAIPLVERQYQDPATLRASAKAAAVEALGRKLTDEEEARFEAAFRAREDTFYDALDTARQNETKFAAYAPDVTGQVSDFIDGDEFETERAANKIGELSQVFMQMMGVSG